MDEQTFDATDQAILDHRIKARNNLNGPVSVILSLCQMGKSSGSHRCPKRTSVDKGTSISATTASCTLWRS
jgi:hypothetical protein